MPGHAHLFAAFSPAAPSLSEWVKGLKAVVARHLKNRQVSAPYWQERFFDHVMRSAESYGQKWLYVRENPVRSGLVANWSDWPYQGEINPLWL
jgi:REP element-mobilizing transposase RayT